MASFRAECEREKTKIIIPFRSYPTPNKKLQNKQLKNSIKAPFRAKIGWKRPRKSENKNYRSVLFLPEA